MIDFSAIISFLKPRLNPWTLCLSSMSFVIVCLIYKSVQNPTGAINQFIILLEDMAFSVFPATPDQYKLSSIIISFSDNYPYFGWGTLKEIFSGFAGMFTIWIVWRVYRALPLIGGG